MTQFRRDNPFIRTDNGQQLTCRPYMLTMVLGIDRIRRTLYQICNIHYDHIDALHTACLFCVAGVISDCTRAMGSTFVYCTCLRICLLANPPSAVAAALLPTPTRCAYIVKWYYCRATLLMLLLLLLRSYLRSCTLSMMDRIVASPLLPVTRSLEPVYKLAYAAGRHSRTVRRHSSRPQCATRASPS